MTRSERAARNALIVAAYRAGQSFESIASAHGIASGTVDCVIRQAGVRPVIGCAACGGRRSHWTASVCVRCYAFKGAVQRAAVALVARAVRLGQIPKAKACTCVDCAGQAHDYDHREYSKPLTVESVCRSCNLKRGPATDLYDLMRARMPARIAA